MSMIYNLTKFNETWETRKLRSLGDFSRGKSTHRPRNDHALYDGGGFPFIQTGDIKAAELFIVQHQQEYNEIGLAQSRLWDKGTLAITIAANIAETGIIAYPMCFPDSVVGFKAFPNETTELYMHYIFAFIRASIQKSVGGSIQDNINIDYLENLNFKIPDKSVQDEIVRVLSTIDRKIALNNAIILELEETAKTLYDYWFVQFDFPDENGKPYKSSGGKMIWNYQLKKKIPSIWGVKELKYFVRIATGSFDPRKFANTIVEQYSIPAFDNGKYPVFELAENIGSTKYGVEKGTILVSKLNPQFSRVWDTYCYSDNAICSTEFIPYRCVDSDLYSFVYTLMNSERFHKLLCANTSSSTGSRSRVTPEDTLNFIFPEPERHIMTSFASVCNPMLSKMKLLYSENKTLTDLRDLLLPLLMNGQVQVL